MYSSCVFTLSCPRWGQLRVKPTHLETIWNTVAPPPSVCFENVYDMTNKAPCIRFLSMAIFIFIKKIVESVSFNFLKYKNIKYYLKH